MQNWYDILPKSVAREQTAWDRRAIAMRMRNLGFTFRAIGEKLGCSLETARLLNIQGRKSRLLTAPILRYQALNAVTFAMADVSDVNKPRILAAFKANPLHILLP